MVSENKGTVLIVDDNRDVLDGVSRYLGRHGIEVVVSESAFELPRLAFLHKPDVIVLDVMMPGLDGSVASTFLRQTPEVASTPIVFFSACDLDRLARIAHSIPNATHVPKATGFRQLKDEVLRILEPSPSSNEH